MSTASPAYRYARNPAAAIRNAVSDQLVSYGKSPRLTWAAILEKGGAPAGSVFVSWDQFALGVKSLGTGVVLAACDVQLAFGDGGAEEQGVTYDGFSELF